MNSTSILEQIIIKRQVSRQDGRMLSTAILIITVVVVAAVALCAFVLSVNSEIGGITFAEVSQSPEMMVAEQFAADVAERGETLFEITNPELNLVLRYEQALAESE